MIFVYATVGLMFIATKFGNNVIQGVKNLYKNVVDESNATNNNVKLNKIIIADSLDKSDNAIQFIQRNMSNNVLGFDCEWVNGSNVSLLQLATRNGICVLFRINKIGCISPKLQELLGNKSILKVGVATIEDGEKLKNDYGVSTVGAVDLRVLADYLKITNRRSLATLSLQYLNVEMNKDSEIRCSDWNADILSEEQVQYAATDAYTSILIYHKMYHSAYQKHSLLKKLMIYFKNMWNFNKATTFYPVPDEVLDKKCTISYPNDEINKNSSSVKRSPPKEPKILQESSKKSNIPTRKEPLYHNCYLEAPDGEILCTCDRKKAEWYIKKQLGIKVKDSPLTVRLNFEPSGRASGKVGEYYTQVKLNQCVVCGSQDKFIKKNVVPREYRKYFPLIMKAHQSHDVLLLCPNCHELSNRYDKDMRKKLEIMCDAPLSVLPENKDQYNQRKFMSTLKVLSNDSKIPILRRQELESQILQYRNNSYNRTQYQPPQQTKLPHGLKVVQYYSRIDRGLVLLEQTWREHFVKCMKPKYLPTLWSIQHNEERLKIRQSQNRIEYEDAKIAGVAH